MEIRDKVTRLRAMYIKAHGQEPRSLILGYIAFAKLEKPKTYIGMTVFVDYDKDNRVEVGNLSGQTDKR